MSVARTLCDGQPAAPASAPQLYQTTAGPDLKPQHKSGFTTARSIKFATLSCRQRLPQAAIRLGHSPHIGNAPAPGTIQLRLPAPCALMHVRTRAACASWGPPHKPSDLKNPPNRNHATPADTSQCSRLNAKNSCALLSCSPRQPHLCGLPVRAPCCSLRRALGTLHCLCSTHMSAPPISNACTTQD